MVVSASLLVGCGVLAACNTSSDRQSGRTDSETQTPATTSAPVAPTTTTVPSGPRGPRGSDQTVTFAFAGDTQFDGQLGAQLEADPNGVLAPVTPVLAGADLAMVNLETAITERGEPVSGKNFHFRSPALSFTALKAAGVDVVNMANNHALDYGPVGMQDTFDAIASSGFPVIGIGHNVTEAFQPYRTVIKGQRIAILSAVDWLEPGLVNVWTATDTQPGLAFSIDRTRLAAAVAAVRPEVDTLVAFLHWGDENTQCASAGQKELARTLIDAGADMVVGSHAHRVFGAGARRHPARRVRARQLRILAARTGSQDGAGCSRSRRQAGKSTRIRGRPPASRTGSPFPRSAQPRTPASRNGRTAAPAATCHRDAGADRQRNHPSGRKFTLDAPGAG